MGNFQKGGSKGGFRGGDRGGRGDFKKKSWGNDRGGDRGPVTMHRATCADCGRNCEVPFRPNGEKPVFCNDCFGGKRDGDQGGRNDFASRPVRREFNDRPAPSFSKGGNDTDMLKKQMSELNTKLDKILNMFEKMNRTPSLPIQKGEPTIIVKSEAKKEPTLKAIVKKVTEEKAPKKSAVKKVVAKKKK